MTCIHWHPVAFQDWYKRTIESQNAITNARLSALLPFQLHVLGFPVARPPCGEACQGQSKASQHEPGLLCDKSTPNLKQFHGPMADMHGVL